MSTPLTLAYAGIIALLALATKINVIRLRLQLKIDLGDGGNARLLQAIRAHANLIENDILALLVIASLELEGLSPTWLHALGLALVVGRGLHIQGLLQSPGASFGRLLGTIITNFVLLIGGAWALYLSLSRIMLAI